MADETPPEKPPETDLVQLTINGRKVYAKPGTVLVDAAKDAGIEIPIFCYEPRLGPPIGACRMCLVEVEGMRGLQTACSTPVAPDMVVHTDNEAAATAQDGVLELLLGNHPLDCPVCDKGGECPLQDQTMKFGPGTTRFVEPKRHFPKPLDLSTVIALDRERCIHCYRCVRLSQEVAEDGQLTFQDRGAGMEVSTFSGEPYEGRFTGNIIDLCPVGALTSIPYRFVSRPWDIENTPSICGHCPVGCNVELTQRDGEVKRMTGRPDPNYRVNEGWLCDKGRWSFPAAWARTRVVQPQVRDENGDLQVVPLEEAVDAAARIIGRSASTAFVVGTDATVEEGFLAARLADTVPGGRVSRMGIPDSPTLQALRGLPAAELADIDGADVVAVVGGDIAEQHPVVELRLRKSRRLGGTLVVIGPRPQVIAGRANESVRTPAGQISVGIPTVAKALQGAKRPIVVWDEADMAKEPDAAAELARVASAARARQIQLAAHVNANGLRALGIPTDGVVDNVAANAISTVVTVHADPVEAPGGARWDTALREVNDLIVIATHRSHITAHASVILPALMHQEHEGVLVSTTGRAQRLRPGARGPEHAAAGWELLIALSHRVGKPLPWRTPSQAFAAVAAEHRAFAGMSHANLGTQGVLLRGEPAPVPTGGVDRREAAGEGIPAVFTTEIFGDAIAWQSDALAALRTQAALRLSPGEADSQGLTEGQHVLVRSPFGACPLPLAIDDALPDGAAFVITGPPTAGVWGLMDADHGPVRVRLEAVDA